MRKHLVIPDTQCKPDVPIEHLGWIGKYAAEKRPDTIIHLGDWYDMPSLSMYDQTANPREHYGRDIHDDLDAGDRSVDLIESALSKAKAYRPRKVYLIGNHEERYLRMVKADPKLARVVRAPWAYAESLGWEVVPFLKPINLDGILYAHYFCRGPSGTVTNSRNGQPSAKLQVIREMQSATAGHKQGLDVHVQPTGAGMKWGIIAGSCYLHEEEYLTAQGTNYWRGVLMKHEVRGGDYNLMQVSLQYLGMKFGERPKRRAA